ncbi:MAG: hypothetical protein K1060chlam2_00396 [Chlamydiae bacterium]|nr:hypothetical protein [Chlamydiota bacterium]
MYQSQASFRFSPQSTPKIVKWTILVTLIISFISLMSSALFTQIFGLPSPQYLFSLTTWGIDHFFLWQFISYLFIQPITSGGISFGLLLHLFFDLYLLWAMGSAIVQSRGKKHFLGLYLGGGLFVGIVAYISLHILGSPASYAGATSSIYMLLIGWVFLFPEARLSLFLIFPIRAKWLVFGMIGVNLFLDFSNGNFLYSFTTASATIFAYLYSVLTWEMLGPFRQLHPMEEKLIYFKRKMRNRIQARPSNIYDFKTGRVTIQDDQFIDECLDKISKSGKGSLTIIERLRMWRISKKRA